MINETSISIEFLPKFPYAWIVKNASQFPDLALIEFITALLSSSEPGAGPAYASEHAMLLAPATLN